MLVRSPCIGICKLTTDETNQEFCSGCKRTVDEIIAWSTMSDNDKLKVLQRLDITPTLTKQ
ncbi:MAG: DUF1289 domain-containing protein [Gammaproteobacteria bacterium]|nr:DUF1289 domain-containing protein [Gammaproteobacteria bacterium]NVK86944.1 DUF1289 domain-containing protein [Gammaproteobacteria bacterium]